MTLPASPSAGDIVAVSDYAQNSETNNITIARNGSNIQGDASDLVIQRNGVSMTLLYVDSTKGWIVANTGAEADKSPNPEYIDASGGTETTCGDFKIHTFTGPGTFTVSNAGNSLGSNTLEYIVVAGGGSGGNNGGGGGAGGFRFASPSLAPVTYPGKPLAAPEGITAAAQAYPITVGGGGPGSAYNSGTNSAGSNSVFSTITSAGGGQGGTNPGGTPTGVGSGGSGGGGSYYNTVTPSPPAAGAAGNTPPVSPPQGNPGGTTTAGPYPHGAPAAGSGGGGALAAGTSASSSLATGGPGGGGAGIPSAFGSNGEPCGSFRYYAGGGGGAAQNTSPGDRGIGGLGGGANSGLQEGTAGSATANTGGGGGGSAGGSGTSGNGGSGIVIIRYKYQ